MSFDPKRPAVPRAGQAGQLGQGLDRISREEGSRDEV